MASEPEKMIVYRNGVPRHVQVYVGPGQAAVDYVDADGEVVATVVHDSGSIPAIAKAKGLDLDEKDLGGPSPRDPHAEAVARTNAESTGQPVPPEEPIEASEPAPEDLTRDQLYEIATSLKIKKRSKMDKDALIAAIAKAKA